LRYAICNETFEGWEHARVCEQAAHLGFQGLEIAPFTLAPRITDITPARRKQIRHDAESAGLKIIGLHWLLAKTEGFQLTSPDAAVRRRTAEYLVELARCTRDLGGDLMVFGSPAQRRIPAGCARAQATDYAVDVFEQTATQLAELEVTLCLEPLSPPEADFINTCAEALAIIERLPRNVFALHLDVKAMSTDDGPTPELIRRHGATAGHFHANDKNRRGPGFGDTDFVPIFQALKDSGYPGWVSVEVFDYTPDPVTIARDSIRYMKSCEAKVA
jgi:sugar phosphate isomerase/epimerase